MRLIDAERLNNTIDWLEKCNLSRREIKNIINDEPTITIKEWIAEMPYYIKRAMLDALLNDMK